MRSGVKLLTAAMSIKKGDLDSPEARGRYVVSIVGCGRMGLPVACLFAEAGFRVVGVDVDQRVVELLRRGKAPFLEPGLAALLKKHVSGGRLTANSDYKAVSGSDFIVFVIDTPVDQKKKPDYSNIGRACKAVGMELRPGSLVIIESTTAPGVTETLIRETLENASGLKAGADFGLAHSPIRASPGRVLQDIATYPKVVGAVDDGSLEAACLFLGTVTKGGMVRVRDVRTAEAAKLFENVQRDVNIALANEFALFCEKAGIDFIEAAEAANTQPYCHLLLPGIVSGHMPKDPYLLVEEAENLSAKLRLTVLARRVNDEVLSHTLRLTTGALRACGKTLRRAKVSVLGVSYRPNVKEVRGHSAGRLVEMLQEKGAKVRVYDPLFTLGELLELGQPGEGTLTKAVEGADCLIFAVGHDRFRRLNLRRIGFLVRRPAAVVDMGHVIDPAKAEGAGFVYRGLGRGVWTR